MGDPKSIREMLNFQELSEEEKQARGILGRLYGPCASIVDATRNGRRYNDELWEKVFSKDNEIVTEMFANGGIPMELDHPVDREETCSEKIAAMMPEPPKRDKDGHLICYIDIIDTPCGKIAYQLAKYGFKLGISSRGTGDLYQDDNGDEVVDPDTYQFTTFDLVLIPAVKDARLSMCESLDTKNIKSDKEFKKALREEIETASSQDRRVMKDTLKDLEIDIDEKDMNEGKTLPGGTPMNTKDIPVFEEDTEEVLTEKTEDEEKDEQAEEKEPKKDEKKEKSKDDEDEDEEDTEDVITVDKLVKDLKKYDKETTVEFAPLTIEGVEYIPAGMTLDDSDEEKIIINVNYIQETGDNIDDENTEAAIGEEEINVEVPEEVAEDDGIDTVMENVKTLVRQKGMLESEVKQLKSEKAVGDAEVKKLKEELDRYKLAFARTSELATNAKKYESDVQSLTEQLAAKDAQIKKLRTAQVNTEKLTESRDTSAAKVKVLTEKLDAVKAENQKRETVLTEKLNEANKLVAARTNIAKQYMSKYNEVLSGYIKSKASMLGVNPVEIKNRLSEKFSIEDIDKVCDSMLTESVGVNRLPYGLTASSRIRVQQSTQASKKENPDNGYAVDDSLLAFLED